MRVQMFTTNFPLSLTIQQPPKNRNYPYEKFTYDFTYETRISYMKWKISYMKLEFHMWNQNFTYELQNFIYET